MLTPLSPDGLCARRGCMAFAPPSSDFLQGPIHIMASLHSDGYLSQTFLEHSASLLCNPACTPLSWGTAQTGAGSFPTGPRTHSTQPLTTVYLPYLSTNTPRLVRSSEVCFCAGPRTPCTLCLVRREPPSGTQLKGPSVPVCARSPMPSRVVGGGMSDTSAGTWDSSAAGGKQPAQYFPKQQGNKHTVPVPTPSPRGPLGVAHT